MIAPIQGSPAFPLRAPDGSASAPAYGFSGRTCGFSASTAFGELQLIDEGAVRHIWQGTTSRLKSDTVFGWASGSADITVIDVGFSRIAAGVLGLHTGTPGAGVALELSEQTAPSAPSANRGRVFMQDNGSGKSQLMVIFPTGPAQQIAIEP